MPEVAPTFDGFRTRDLRQRAATWLDGRTYVVRPGIDYPSGVKPKNIQAAVYKAAQVMGVRVTTRRPPAGESIDVNGAEVIADGNLIVVKALR